MTKKRTYDDGNPNPVLGQTQKCDKDKPVNEILTLPILKIGLPTDINQQKLITQPYRFASTQKFPQTSYQKMNDHINMDSTTSSLLKAQI